MRRIVCHVSEKDALPILIESLKKLEYLGYDSAGSAVRSGVEVHLLRSVGKISGLDNKINFTGSCKTTETTGCKRAIP
jgi:glucosamine--fructose-6-phosphate aminotransferase (isomerizing)